MLTGILTILVIILLLIVLLIAWAIGSYNALVRGKNQVEEAFSTMDVYLKKRYDLIPNLVETVKGYAKHEKETLDAVIKARNAASGATSMETRMENEAAVSQGIRSIFALAEAYPDLKANASFTALQGQLTQIEADIANSRKYYNGTVRAFNDRTMTFPSNMIAGMFGFGRQPLFEVANDAERENVQVKFD